MTTDPHSKPNSEFYIGYAQKVPPGIRNFLLALIPGLVVLAAILGFWLPGVHNQYGLGALDRTQDFQGVLMAQPVPHLAVPRQGNTGEGGAYSRYLLSAFNKAAFSLQEYDLNLIPLDSPDDLPTEGKSLVIVAKIGDYYHTRIFNRTGGKVIDKGKGEFTPDKKLVQQLEAGFGVQSIDNQTKSELIQKVTSSLGYTIPQNLEELSGQWVNLKGLPVYRDQFTLLASGGATAADPPTDAPMAPPEGKSLGEFTLSGQIVDSKCYLGVMKPGESATHRNCAIRCISGGVPPALRVQNTAGDLMYLALVGRDGQSSINNRILSRVGSPVKVTGEVMQYDDLYVLQADPEEFRL